MRITSISLPDGTTPESHGWTLGFNDGVLSPNPHTIGYWRFEEGTPDSAAVGANSIVNSSETTSGTPHGNPFYRSDVPSHSVPQTKATNAVSLQLQNGVGNYVIIPDPSGILNPTDAFTVEFWMKAANLQPEGSTLVVDHTHGFTGSGSDSTGWAFQFEPPGKLDFGIGRSASADGLFPYAQAPTILLDDTWHHIAGTFDIADVGDEIKLYVDGILVDSQASGGPFVPNFRDVEIGRAGNNGRFYNGFIDELRISNYALRPSEFLLAIPGDFNSDHTVDAADYIVWRDSGGTQEEYNRWRANFGRTFNGNTQPVTELSATVPEPLAATPVLLALFGLACARRFPFERQHCPSYVR
jgi:hypothetical protein